jgi:hypothetical protein
MKSIFIKLDAGNQHVIHDLRLNTQIYGSRKMGEIKRYQIRSDKILSVDCYRHQKASASSCISGFTQ